MPRLTRSPGQHQVGRERAAVVQGQPVGTAFAVDRRHRGAETPARAGRFESVAQPVGRRFGQQARQGPGGQVDQRGCDAARQQVVGEFAADQAGPEDDHLAGVFEALGEAGVVVQVIDRQHLGRRVALQRQADRVGARGDHQVAVVEPAAVGQLDPAAGGVDAAHRAAGMDGGIQLGGHLVDRLHHQRSRGLLAGQGVGQHWLGIETGMVAADQDQRCILVQLAEFAGEGVAGQAGAEDDERV